MSWLMMSWLMVKAGRDRWRGFGGSWVVISRFISPLLVVIILITLLITNHEPPKILVYNSLHTVLPELSTTTMLITVAALGPQGRPYLDPEEPAVLGFLIDLL